MQPPDRPEPEPERAEDAFWPEPGLPSAAPDGMAEALEFPELPPDVASEIGKIDGQDMGAVAQQSGGGDNREAQRTMRKGKSRSRSPNTSRERPAQPPAGVNELLDTESLVALDLADFTERDAREFGDKGGFLIEFTPRYYMKASEISQEDIRIFGREFAIDDLPGLERLTEPGT